MENVKNVEGIVSMKPFNPIERAKKVEKIVMRSDKRKYYSPKEVAERLPRLRRLRTATCSG